MPVDRNARDQLAEATIRFLSTEANNNELHNIIHKFWGTRASKDESIDLICEQLDSTYDDLFVHTVRMNREEWDWVLRLLAFLQSDLHVERIRWKVPHRRQRLALLWWALGAPAAVVGWFLVSPLWTALAVLFLGFLSYAVPDHIKEDHYPLRRYPFAPFHDEEQAGRHESLLDRAKLPKYDPQVHGRVGLSDDCLTRMLAGCAAVFFLPIALLWDLRSVRMQIALVRMDDQAAPVEATASVNRRGPPDSRAGLNAIPGATTALFAVMPILGRAHFSLILSRAEDAALGRNENVEHRTSNFELRTKEEAGSAATRGLVRSLFVRSSMLSVQRSTFCSVVVWRVVRFARAGRAMPPTGWRSWPG